MNYYLKYIKYKTKYLELCNRLNINQDGGAKQSIKIDDDMKLIKTLGAGMFGTTYLTKYQDKEYAIKIQHILEKDQYVNFKNEMWRELDLYKYINKLSSSDQLFFTKLHDYLIYDNCKHIQKRPYKINIEKDKLFAKKLKELDESTWCVKYLLDYKGNTTLYKFLLKYKLTVNLIYSICLQICKIVLILNDGGYSHNDLHTGNIMINKTSKLYFSLDGERIPYEGYQISAIDYGEILNKKFKIKYKGWSKKFILDPSRWLFNEIFYSTMSVIENISIYIDDCKKQKKKLPWEHKNDSYSNGFKKIIKNHNNFYIMVRDKYVKIFPKGEKLLDNVISNIEQNNKKTIHDLVKNNKNELDFYDIICRIIYEFWAFYPKEHSIYFKWCSYHKSVLPTDVIQDLLLITNTTEYITYLKNKLIY